VALTETATFLFTDLVGSTAVTTMLDRDAARAHATAQRHGYAQLERRSGALLAQAARP